MTDGKGGDCSAPAVGDRITWKKVSVVKVKAPPGVPGVIEPHAIDSFRLVWWLGRAFWHGATRGTGAVRVRSAVLVVFWVFSSPVLVIVYPFILRSANRRYYMSARRDAVLAVVATKIGWTFEDHTSSRPGTGQGKKLRQQVLPAIVAAADQAQVVIIADAATPQLAAQYMSEIPGMVDVGPARPRGRKLYRPPATVV